MPYNQQKKNNNNNNNKKKTILFYSLYRNLLVINVYLDGTSTNANQKYKTY